MEMSKQIQWVKDFNEALSRAKSENKLVFVDFYNPQ